MSQINTESARMSEAHFDHCFRSIGAQCVSAFAALESAYDEAHRAYHTAEHITASLAWLEQVQSLADHPRELAVAIYFHDIVYVPGAGDNELQSARRFRVLAQRAQVPGAAAERIAALILSTQRHDAPGGDAALLNDIDLAILGAAPACYRRFERAIRLEHASLDDRAFVCGRRAVLRGFLERMSLYRTPFFASRLEVQARANLGAALVSLECERSA